MKTEEGNKLIAVFDGWSFLEDGNVTRSDHSDHGRLIPLRADILSQYHSSWDWLMPVVEKIWKMGKMISLNLYTGHGGVNCKIYNWDLGDPYQEAETEEPINSVWEAVVQFIQWYLSSQTPTIKQ